MCSMPIYPWQARQWQQLSEAYQQQRLSHAYLLAGDAGLGKLAFARAFAQFLLCECKQKEGQACGSCRGCRWVNADTHPDLLWMMPHEKSHSIKIDAVREMTQKVSQTAQCGSYQVIVLSPAEAMPPGAANALLKTLEEPPGKVVLLLVSDQPDRLLPTIVSRSQKVMFSACQTKLIFDWLAPKVSDNIDLSVLLKVSSYAPLRAQQLLEANYFSLRDALLEHLWNVSNEKVSAIMHNSGWAKLDKSLVLQGLLSLCVDISRVKQGVSADYLLNSDREAQLHQLSQKISTLSLERFIQQVCAEKKKVDNGANLNMELVLDALFISWWELISVC